VLGYNLRDLVEKVAAMPGLMTRTLHCWGHDSVRGMVVHRNVVVLRKIAFSGPAVPPARHPLLPQWEHLLYTESIKALLRHYWTYIHIQLQHYSVSIIISSPLYSSTNSPLHHPETPPTAAYYSQPHP